MSYAERCKIIQKQLDELMRDIEAERKTADAKLSRFFAKRELTKAEDTEVERLEELIDLLEDRIDTVDRAGATLSYFR